MWSLCLFVGQTNVSLTARLVFLAQTRLGDIELGMPILRMRFNSIFFLIEFEVCDRAWSLIHGPATGAVGLDSKRFLFFLLRFLSSLKRRVMCIFFKHAIFLLATCQSPSTVLFQGIYNYGLFVGKQDQIVLFEKMNHFVFSPFDIPHCDTLLLYHYYCIFIGPCSRYSALINSRRGGPWLWSPALLNSKRAHDQFKTVGHHAL